MQTQEEFNLERSRQQLFRRLAPDARLDALITVGVPVLPEAPTEPAPVRWQALIDQAHAALETASDEMGDYTFEPGTVNQKE